MGCVDAGVLVEAKETKEVSRMARKKVARKRTYKPQSKPRQRKRGVRLLSFAKPFVEREVFTAMDDVSHHDLGVIKISDVHDKLRKRGWSISYDKVSEIVKREMPGTSWELYKDAQRRRKKEQGMYKKEWRELYKQYKARRR